MGPAAQKVVAINKGSVRLISIVTIVAQAVNRRLEVVTAVLRRTGLSAAPLRGEPCDRKTES